MANLGSYTTTQAVRGCLGVDANDVRDAYLVDSKVDLELSLDLDDWLPNHAVLYSAGTTGSPTAAQVAIANRITLYAQWFCTLEVANRPLTVPAITTDGKAQIDRFKVDLAKVAELAAAKVAKYKAELDDSVNNVTPVAPYADFVSVAAPGADPVTEGLQ